MKGILLRVATQDEEEEKEVKEIKEVKEVKEVKECDPPSLRYGGQGGMN